MERIPVSNQLEDDSKWNCCGAFNLTWFMSFSICWWLAIINLDFMTIPIVYSRERGPATACAFSFYLRAECNNYSLSALDGVLWGSAHFHFIAFYMMMWLGLYLKRCYIYWLMGINSLLLFALDALVQLRLGFFLSRFFQSNLSVKCLAEIHNRTRCELHFKRI